MKTRTEVFNELVDAEAKLIAEHGWKALVKDGPIKWEAQGITFKRNVVLRELVRERVAKLTGKDAKQLDAELNAAVNDYVVEQSARPDVELTKTEERAMHAERMAVTSDMGDAR